MSRILIVDDEESICRALSGILEDEGFSTEAVLDGEAALERLESQSQPDLVLLDIAMPGADGIEVLATARERWPHLPVIMMSGHGTIETAVKATRLGAYDFIEKPLSFDKLLLTIEHALEQEHLREENLRLRGQAIRAHEILGDSEPITRLKAQIGRAAPTNGWVLITGENGTGKELVARQIHVRSKRADEPFVDVNCAAIPEELIESELFGHERGAFTGAIAKKRGRFELAHRGTLFLDEIADMSLMTQAKILRILQERKFERVGGIESIEVDVRVVAATNKDLQKEIEAGRFREDLYYRLNVIPFHVPPLRERRDDIPVLVAAFATEFCADSRVRPKEITPAAMARLEAQPWPGNVRELRNLMERLVLMTPGPTIDAEDVPEPLALPGSPGVVAAVPTGSLEDARRSFERGFLIARLREHGGNISRTADAIGLARETLSRKIRAHGIDPERE